VELLEIDPGVRDRQVKRLKELRARRSNERVQKALEDLRRAAEGSGSLFPFLLAAVESYATLGEISDAMRDAWGEYKE